MLTSTKKTLIIAAICSRPYVQAATSAGFEVIAIDCFADDDTKRLAKGVHLVTLENGQLASQALIKIVAQLALSEGVVGFCYGAGMEMQSTVIAQINQYCNILGNCAHVVAQSKSPYYFYTLCDDIDIPHPEVTFTPPQSAHGWLQKTIGGSGGTHIKRLTDVTQPVDKQVFFQKWQSGKPISCLFLANAKDVQIVGFNEQWVDVNTMEPFRYGGAVSKAEISVLATSRFINYVKELTLAMGLLGLNSCDAICDGDDIYVLEVNPRLSATIDLYTEEKRLMASHVAASQKTLTEEYFLNEEHCLNTVNDDSQAHQVIYAKQDFKVRQNISWPTWVSDVPQAASFIKSGMPICTVNAKAEKAVTAKKLVNDRAIALSHQLLN